MSVRLPVHGSLPEAARPSGSVTDFSQLTALKRGARENDPAAVREAARQFESLFARTLLSSMRAASFGDSLLGSEQQDFYRGMFDDQLAMELTRGRGLGLADMLVEQLTRAGWGAAESGIPDTAHPPEVVSASGNAATETNPALKNPPGRPITSGEDAS